MLLLSLFIRPFTLLVWVPFLKRLAFFALSLPQIGNSLFSMQSLCIHGLFLERSFAVLCGPCGLRHGPLLLCLSLWLGMRFIRRGIVGGLDAWMRWNHASVWHLEKGHWWSIIPIHWSMVAMVGTSWLKTVIRSALLLVAPCLFQPWNLLCLLLGMPQRSQRSSQWLIRRSLRSLWSLRLNQRRQVCLLTEGSLWSLLIQWQRQFDRRTSKPSVRLWKMWWLFSELLRSAHSFWCLSRTKSSASVWHSTRRPLSFGRRIKPSKTSHGPWLDSIGWWAASTVVVSEATRPLQRSAQVAWMLMVVVNLLLLSLELLSKYYSAWWRLISWFKEWKRCHLFLFSFNFTTECHHWWSHDATKNCPCRRARSSMKRATW